jgi:hypothetical protein
MSRSQLEESLAQQLDFAARDERAPWPWPAPVREHHFDWCCEHGRRFQHAPPAVTTAFCGLCEVLNSDPQPGDPVAGTFHEYRKGRDWRFDFAWPELKVAVECDGGTRSGGRHVRPLGFEGDMDKLNAAALAGWTVVRVTQRHISSGEALALVERALEAASRD